MNENERERYEPAAIEPKWQAYWDERHTFRAERRAGHAKAYILDMFPYPSGSGLHVGHPEGYTATDIVARYQRMRGLDVLHPMGWDAFGLPAEQYAIQTGTHPRATTEKNIQTFRRQLKMLGLSYDWEREVDTTDPAYVKWTQWIWLQLFKRGLAYQSEIAVNWCAALGTVLSNEEVVDGLSERGDHPVEKLPLRQWMLRITAYADRLESDLEGLDWPDTKEKQRYWIGRSEGALVDFAVQPREQPTEGETITVFTTRVDTLAGATYVVIAPEHPLALKITTPEHRAAAEAYLTAAKVKSDIDRSDATKKKTGVPTGAFAVNPINGDALPVWIADYVIGTYGTGAVMAVPAHDERDHAFATIYGLPIPQVIAPKSGAGVDVAQQAYTPGDEAAVAYRQRTHGSIPIADGTPAPEVRRQVTAWLAAEKRGGPRVTYRLRDWVFSRQRYWGEPIPVYFPCETKGDPRAGAEFTIRYDQPIAVEEAELPLRLPDLEDFAPTGNPEGPLAKATDWRFFQKDGQWFARETNTMPQWAGSCWYFLRFVDPTNSELAFSPEAYAAWMPVDLYVGGSEHAVLHLLYARFWHKVLFDQGLVTDAEPFRKLVHQGTILGENGIKMSKSRGNVVNPDDVVRSHGADSLRVYEMFMGPLEAVKPWQTSGIEGVRRFLDRVWNVCTGELTSAEADEPTKRLLHKTIKKVGEDIESLRFNTAISAMMILVKQLLALDKVPEEAARTLALLVSPFAPHLGEELWQRLGATESLALHPWPAFEQALTKDDVVELGVQVNGKMRGTVQLSVTADEATARAAALAEPKVQAQVAGKTIKKMVYVPGKIINLIAG